jgi:hypothetical protein
MVPVFVGDVVMVNLGEGLPDLVVRNVQGAWTKTDTDEFSDYQAALVDLASRFWWRTIDRYAYTITERYNRMVRPIRHIDLEFRVLDDGVLLVTGFESGITFEVFEACFPVEILDDAPCDLRLSLATAYKETETPREK